MNRAGCGWRASALYGAVLFTLAVTPFWEAPKNIGVGLAVLFWLLLPRGQRCFPRPLHWLAWLVVIALFAAIGGISPWDGLMGTVDWLRILLFSLAAAAAMVTVGRLRLALTVVAVSTAVAAAYVLLRTAAGHAPPSDVRAGLSVLSLGFSNHSATYLALALCCQLYLFSLPERWARIAGASAIIPTALAVWSTSSRGAWVALALAGGYFLLRRGNRRIILTLLAGALLLSPLLLSSPTAYNQLSSFWRATLHGESEGVMQWRARLWQECGAVMVTQPWLGVGPKNYKWLEMEYNIQYGKFTDHAHNVLVNIGVETGLFGVLAFIGFLISGVVCSIRTGLPENIVGQTAVIVMLVAGMATTTFHTEGGLLFAALLGMICGAGSNWRTETHATALKPASNQ